MPLINIKLIPDGINAQQKAKVIAGVTKVLADELGKNPAQTIVIIEDIPAENLGCQRGSKWRLSALAPRASRGEAEKRGEPYPSLY